MICIRQKPPDLTGEIEKSTIIVVGFNIPISLTNEQTNINKSEGLEKIGQGRLGGSAVERLPLAQGMILGSWDRVPPLLLPLPVSLPLSVSLTNK